jgi:hypothetical protein
VYQCTVYKLITMDMTSEEPTHSPRILDMIPGKLVIVFFIFYALLVLWVVWDWGFLFTMLFGTCTAFTVIYIGVYQRDCIIEYTRKGWIRSKSWLKQKASDNGIPLVKKVLELANGSKEPEHLGTLNSTSRPPPLPTVGFTPPDPMENDLEFGSFVKE